jgi:tetratricopeptide (TPR) repeat protein
VGIGLNKLGKKEAATADVDEGVKQYNQSLTIHDINGGDIIWAGELLNPVSDFYVETNQISKAASIWDNYIALINPFVTRNPEDTSSIGYLSYAYERKGDSLAIYQKERDAFAQTNISNLRAALTSYQTALEHRHRVLQLDPTNQNHIEAEQSLALKISRLRERIE